MNSDEKTQSRRMEIVINRMKQWFESFLDGTLPSPEEVRHQYLAVYEDVYGAPPPPPD